MASKAISPPPLTASCSSAKTQFFAKKTNLLSHRHVQDTRRFKISSITIKKRALSSGKGFGAVKCMASAAPSVLPKALCSIVMVCWLTLRKMATAFLSMKLSLKKNWGVTWDVDLYGELLKIGVEKKGTLTILGNFCIVLWACYMIALIPEVPLLNQLYIHFALAWKMTAYFNKAGWPDKAPKSDEERKEFVASLHKRKTELFMALIEKKLLPLRPGVAKLIDQALGNGINVAVCSTSNEKAVSAVVSFLLGPERAEKIQIFAGDVVPRKKPDPAIYLLAAETLGVEPSSCVVVEDSAIGLAAAKAAGMTCIVTKSGYTGDEDFVNADAVFDCIGDPPEERFDLAFCGSLLEKQYVS
ncbi:UNVERIFIED_CONTAM: CBBY-like protein [Sesamum radiatum]|uniref:CBBY-like protein n=1 Tax=Sesamum radiatum TaxID=300843 RepID=A0AAW2WKB0_SESRA